MYKITKISKSVAKGSWTMHLFLLILIRNKQNKLRLHLFSTIAYNYYLS